MKFIQLIIEALLLVSIGFEVVWTIQLNATVRMPSKILFLLFGMVVLVVLVLVFEFAETRRTLRKNKEKKEKFEAEVKNLKQTLDEKEKELESKENEVTALENQIKVSNDNN